MPVEVAGVALSRAGRFYSVDINLIEVEEGANPRTIFDPDKQARLEASIAENGVLQPLSVRKDGSRIILEDGECRLRAVKALMARGHEFKDIVVEFEESRQRLSPAERLVRKLERNTTTALTPLEEARAYLKLMKVWNWSQADIARCRGISQSVVSVRLALLDATPAVIEAHANGDITPTDVVSIVRESRKDGAAPDDVLIERARKAKEPLTQAEKEEKVKVQFRKCVEKMGMLEVVLNLIDCASDAGSHELMAPLNEIVRLVEMEEGISG